MNNYAPERKEATLLKMMPPINMAIAELAAETGITRSTLYYWRKQVKSPGVVVPEDGKNAEQWSSTDKFSAVLETAVLNAEELEEYCRKKGFLPSKLSYKNKRVLVRTSEKTGRVRLD